MLKPIISKLYQWLCIPQLQVALGSMLISFSPVFVRYTHTAPTIDGFYRMLVGTLLLTSVSILSKQTLRFSFPVFILLFLAALSFSLDLVFWHQSIDLIGPGLATILISLQVFVLVLIGVVFFSEGVMPRFFLALPLVLLGMYFLVGLDWWQEGAVYRHGVVLGLIGMLFYSAYVFVLRESQRVTKPFSAVCSVALISFFATIILGLIAWCQGQSFLISRWQDGLSLVLYGLFSQTIGWWLIAKGLPKTRLSLAGFLLLLQPTFAFIWDVIFFHRPTRLIEVIGALLTLVAIYCAATARKIDCPN